MATNPWLDVSTARADLRRFLNDGPSDRPVKMKQVVGLIDGANKQFMTWEDRLVDGTLVVSVDFVDLAGSQVTVNDSTFGIFTLVAAPQPGQIVRARYYHQFFTDAELDESLQMAAIECVDGDDITLVPLMLKTAALNFGGHFSYQKQAIRWANQMSTRFVLEEQPTEQDLQTKPSHYRQIAQDYWKQGVIMRDGAYMRRGRRNAPAVAVNKPRLRPLAPRR
jgi:hypothetical protein